MSLDLQTAVEQRTNALRQYVGTEMHAHLLALLAALRQTYLEQLAHIGADQLQLKQGAVRQVDALLDAIQRPHQLPLV